MEEAIYYHAVATALHGNYGSIAKLVKKFGSWKAAYEALARADAAAGGLGAAAADPEKEWNGLARAGIRLSLFGDDDFPAALRELGDPPFGLYARGTLPQANAIAVVGTRRATPEGKNIARRFARELAQSGFVIVSGLAFGIDAAAHEGCLEAGGTTIAVLAGGLHDIYPHENARLAAKILEAGGAIVSEYPPGEPPYQDRFLERNRLISGLARGVLIVEAPRGSGSLATARRALDQNRDVFVVPGAIAHPNFAGSHALIRQGAELVTAPEDIFDSYGVTREEKIAAREHAASREEILILEALRGTSAPLEVDKIAAATKLEPHIVNRAVSFLVLKNSIRESGGGYTI